MPRLVVPSRPRAWPRVAVLALVGVAVAGCENSSRFDSNPFASNVAAAPGSDRLDLAAAGCERRRRLAAAAGAEQAVDRRGQRRHRQRRARSWRLPPGRARIYRLGARASGGGASAGSGADRPLDLGRRRSRSRLATARRSRPSRARTACRSPRSCKSTASPMPPRSGPASGWSFRVMSPAARRQRRGAGARRPSPPRPCMSSEPGESMMGIARRHGVTLSALAQANNIQPYAKISIGDRLTIPRRRARVGASGAGAAGGAAAHRAGAEGRQRADAERARRQARGA